MVLTAPSLAALFDSVVFRTGAYAAYQKLAALSPGETVHRGEREGEALTLESDGLVAFGLGTAPFDDEGIPSRRLAVVRDGQVAARWATQQYAEYLGMEATGAFANTRVACGARPRAELLADGGVLEVVAFSAFDPDSVTGDFGAEVRLGYLHGPGGTVPVKGGSVSGNVYEALARAWYSKEEATHEAYVGPAAVRLEGLSVSGA